MPRLDDFVADVSRSGLVPSEIVQRSLSSLPSDGQADRAVRLAQALISRGHLTPYQARKLLSGVTRGFFLGGYRILKPLGEGGMGKVYLAEREGSTERVAIKVLPPKKAQEEEQALKRFLREMDLSRRVSHPNLARVIDAGNEGNVHFMVMEYIPGESLYDAVKGKRGGPLRVNDAARLFVRVLDGLAAAHAAGLVHRDIKPSNIMITPEGEARLLDLGLARATGSDEEKPLTRDNFVVGTLDYVSPEQLTDASRADGRSDLYSIGCAIYFTIAGRPPFEGGDMINKIFKQRMEDPEPLERVARGVPAAFSAIVKKLMAKNPNDRYQTCEELRADLVRWTDPEKVRAILGAEADAARAFRPPVLELDDDDLRLLPDDTPGSPSVSLRDLGDAEPGAAPYQRPPVRPVPAVTVPSTAPRPPSLEPEPLSSEPESNWLMQFIAVAVVLGLLAILAIMLFQGK